MQSWCPGIQGFEAAIMNFGYFLQYSSPNKKHNLKFLIPPSELALGSIKYWKIQSWGPGFHSFEAVYIELWGICLTYLHFFGTYNTLLTFSEIKKIEIYRKRLTFHLVELRPKSKSYAKSVVVLVIPHHGQSRWTLLVLHVFGRINLPLFVVIPTGDCEAFTPN